MPSSIANLRVRVGEARLALLQPEPDLSAVLRTLQSVAEGMAGGPGGTPGEIEALRAELGRVRALARRGLEFWQGWGRLLGVDPSYSSAGTPAVLPAPTVEVQG